MEALQWALHTGNNAWIAEISDTTKCLKDAEMVIPSISPFNLLICAEDR